MDDAPPAVYNAAILRPDKRPEETAMKLTPEQLEAYDRDGFLVFPSLLDGAEVAAIRRDIEGVSGVQDDRILREKVGGPRMIYGLDDPSGPTGTRSIETLVRTPRLLQPAMDVLDDQVYIYHTKCNFKSAIDGAIWQWHQDYGYWHNDGTPEPRLVTTMIMLDKATEMSGCLYFMRGSHKLGTLDGEFDGKTTSVGLWIVPKDRMISMCGELGEPVPVVGEAGTVVMFHPDLVHGSGHNMSPRPRWQLYVVYNADTNRPHPVEQPRPEYKAARRTPALRPSERAIAARVPEPA